MAITDPRFRDICFQDAEGARVPVSEANPLPVGSVGGGSSQQFATPIPILALDETPATVSAEPCSLSSYELEQPNQEGVWLHLYDVAAGSVVVGTTPPTASIWLPAGDGQSALHQRDWATPLAFEAATAAVTADLAGTTPPTLPLTVVFGVLPG